MTNEESPPLQTKLKEKQEIIKKEEVEEE